jgi:anti-sigma B factor antagonist
MAVPTEAFEVRVEHDSAYDVAQIRGDLDVFTANQLRDVLTEPDRWQAPVLVLDLTTVAFLDSTGLSALVAARRLARAREAELRVVCPAGAALRVIRMTKLDSVLGVFPDMDAALAASARA